MTGLSELERAVAVAALSERVDQLEERAIEDRARIKATEDSIGALRRFQAWLMAGIAIIGFLAGKAVEPILDKVFK